MDKSPIPDFTVALLTAVLVMDGEAVPTASGETTGLYYYGRYRHPDQKRPQTEPSWSERLVELLATAGYQVRNECEYPTVKGSLRPPRCDNLITFEDGRTLWLENKGAWKDYWVNRGARAKFRSHLLTSDNSAAHDVRKLLKLHPSCADFVGLLLIGFEAVDDPMTAEFEELMDATDLGKAPWQMARLDFPDRWRSSHRVRVWFFSRSVRETL